MPGSDRANKLNAQAVEKLNNAMSEAQSGDEPDFRQIISDLLSGKPAATLNKGSGWKTTLFVIALCIAALWGGKEIVGGLLLLFFIYVIIPVIAGWLYSFADIGRSGPKCSVSGCGSSASYMFSPAGMDEVRLCSTCNSTFAVTPSVETQS